jgi:hypothetical protein
MEGDGGPLMYRCPPGFAWLLAMIQGNNFLRRQHHASLSGWQAAQLPIVEMIV